MKTDVKIVPDKEYLEIVDVATNKTIGEMFFDTDQNLWDVHWYNKDVDTPIKDYVYNYVNTLRRTE